MKVFEQYFVEEMRSLHQDAQKFAEEFPEQASMLNLKELRDKDPYIERLLEGVAFLTAQVRQQIDHSEWQISETLLEQIAPELLRPIPAMTVMEFKPKINAQYPQFLLPKELEVFSKNSHNLTKAIKFSICDNLIIYPIYLKRLYISDHALHFMLQTLPHANFNQLNLEEIPIYLHAEYTISLELFLLLTSSVVSVEIELGQQGIQKKVLPKTAITAHNVFRLLPESGRSWVGLGLLQDYFSLREKYLFIKLTQLDFLKDLDDEIQEIKVTIKFSEDSVFPEGLTLDNFKLHCIPAVNLTTTYGEPISYNYHELDYLVVADYAEPEVMIYDVVSIEANYNDSRPGYAVEPFYKINKTSMKQPAYHIINRQYNQKNSQLKLNFSNLNEENNLSLQTKILVFHGDKPRQYLQEGLINQVEGKYASVVEAKNLTRPTAMLLPPAQLELQQQVLSFLRYQLEDIDSRESFCQLLHQFDWSKKRENKQRIEGIRKIEVLSIEKFIRGCLVSGYKWCFYLESSYYASISDAYHFGYVLHQFLLTYNNLNEVIETKILIESSQYEWIWKE